jgi:predicted nucleotidyltransferase
MNKKRKFGLLASDIDKIVSIFESNHKIEKVILFGSRAKGNFKPGSDIDITIQGSDLKLDDILIAKVKVDELSLPYKMDIIIFERINEKALLEHIDRVGIVLFDRKNQTAVRM